MNRMLARHTRVWPASYGCISMMDARLDAIEQTALDLWRARGWPLVVRRFDDDAVPDASIAVGIALPPAFGKRRVRLRLPRDAVTVYAAPLTLDEAIGQLDSPWRHALTPIACDAARAKVTLRVFGSVAWQAQTGLHYLHADSDIDLLAAPANIDELDAAIALFERSSVTCAVRVDGEIMFPGGDAVAWREWKHAAPNARVLAKNVMHAALVSRKDLARRLTEASTLAA